MKPVSIFTLFLTLCLSTLSAQNYQSVISNRIVYFEGDYGYISCIKIDSVKFDTDSFLYPIKSIRQLDYDCFTPYGDSWIGEKVIVKDKGINLFFNKNHDTIRIETRAKLNDEWTAFYLTDSITIKAAITRHDTLRFMGLVDSVKTIDFIAYDKNMNPVEIKKKSNRQMKISKNYGLVQTFDMYYFTLSDEEYSYFQSVSDSYKLAGLSSPKIGVQNLSRFDINDFAVGNELHILDESYNDGSGHSFKIIYNYLDKKVSPDSITYLIDRQEKLYYKNYNGENYTYIHDTITQIIKPDSIFDRYLPNEPIIDDWSANSYRMISDSVKIDNSFVPEIYKTEDSCWSNCCWDGCNPIYTYYKGLGGPYYYCDNFFSMGYAQRKLVYYKKGDKEWGTPLVITAIDEKQAENTINIYPNPASDVITIERNNAATKIFFELSDLNGRQILEEELKLKSEKIELYDLEPGIYIYTIRCSNTIYKTDKLILVK
ncbi:T9SS type A sorting domain-containing protein [Saccharicrinis sp. FJH62]|uniref:T9SS type A sorting domain-containing protein n=1 Tax=Saccharicrinis sp. FJH62 TaxID=3344657 RepID=UPI0035D4A53D